jgi:hypothetical protein
MMRGADPLARPRAPRRSYSLDYPSHGHYTLTCT